MKYYKILTNEHFIGVVNSDEFLRESPKKHYLLSTAEDYAQFVIYDGIIYRAYWMSAPTSNLTYTEADIIEITEEEYYNFKTLLNENKREEIEEAEFPVQPLRPTTDITVDFAREQKIQSLSRECQSTIEQGVTVEGNHYSLTATDQLNL